MDEFVVLTLTVRFWNLLAKVLHNHEVQSARWYLGRAKVAHVSDMVSDSNRSRC
jgi:hypothetical protein